MFCLFTSFSYAQSQDSIKNLLCRKWQLIVEDICDECPQFIPDTVITISFNKDMACIDYFVKEKRTVYGSWSYHNDSLTIRYLDNGENRNKNYRIRGISEKYLILDDEDSHWFPGGERSFKSYFKN